MAARTDICIEEVFGFVCHVRPCRSVQLFSVAVPTQSPRWRVAQHAYGCKICAACAAVWGDSATRWRAVGPDCLMGRGSLCAPKFLPTMQCQVGLCFLSNSFFMYAAMSFSMVNFSSACTQNRTRSNVLICRCNKAGGVPLP